MLAACFLSISLSLLLYVYVYILFGEAPDAPKTNPFTPQIGTNPFKRLPHPGSLIASYDGKGLRGVALAFSRQKKL
jgi:hypothetical protein